MTEMIRIVATFAAIAPENRERFKATVVALTDLAASEEGTLEMFRAYRAAFPDLRMDAEEILASGDKTVARVTASGTQNGEFMGMPASGKSVEVHLIDIMRFDDAGLVCEHWGVIDMLSLLQQLGAVPDGAPA